MIQLYFDPSCPFCVRVLRYFEQEQIPFEPKEMSLWMDSPTKQELIRIGGKSQVPFLVDPDNGVQMYESADIIEYAKGLQQGS